ncbi:MAG: hypothetical protein JRI25_09200 [Deltaproteobacteria bacterium]|nr:hypothetical protein [Deltaproteobacteria bacterium]
MLVLAASHASAATLHVGSGQTYATVGLAVAAAQDDDVIQVHEGTYNEFVTLPELTLEIVGIDGADLVILAGTDADSGFFLADGAAVSATIRDVTFDGEGSYSALMIESEADVTLDGVVVTNTARAVDVVGGSLTIHDSVFGTSTAGWDGGHIRMRTSGSHLEVHGSRFEGGTAGRNGGSIDTREGTVEVYDSVFVGNSAENGGAIRCDRGASCIVHTSVFDANTAVVTGGAVSWEDALLAESSDNLYCGNATTGNNSVGGALSLYTSTGVVVRNIFVESFADGWGGAVYLGGNSNSVTMNDNDFVANETNRTGSAVYHNRGTTVVFNDLFLDNVGGNALEENQGSLTLTYSLFFGNSPGDTDVTPGTGVRFGEDPLLPGYVLGSCDPSGLEPGVGSPLINNGDPNYLDGDGSVSDIGTFDGAWPWDADGDGFLPPEDCDDTDPDVNPDATETCDGVDEDCNGIVDDGFSGVDYYPDSDTDGFGDETATPTTTCDGAPPGMVADATDCDDSLGSINPGATEVCNGVDDDCDDVADDGLTFSDWYPDTDSDLFGDETAPPTSTCDGAPAGMVADATDCDDSLGSINPDADEVCNAIDDDCNDLPDDGLTFSNWYPDTDSDLFGDETAPPTSTCDGAPAGMIADATDCDDSLGSINPDATEVCNGVDDDCNDLVDEGFSPVDYYPDGDGDGFGDEAAAPTTACDGAPPGMVTDASDCDDSLESINPDADEVCNGVDDDCDDDIDEGLVGEQEFYLDSDGDGFGDPDATESPCNGLRDGLVENAGDCDDSDHHVYPGAPEVTDDGIDQDCSGYDTRTQLTGGEPMCGCAGVGSGGRAALPLLMALVAFRKRRPTRPAQTR